MSLIASFPELKPLQTFQTDLTPNDPNHNGLDTQRYPSHAYPTHSLTKHRHFPSLEVCQAITHSLETWRSLQALVSSHRSSAFNLYVTTRYYIIYYYSFTCSHILSKRLPNLLRICRRPKAKVSRSVTPTSSFESNDVTREAMTAEEAQQAFLSRLLLMLGSLVILCLLVF